MNVEDWKLDQLLIGISLERSPFELPTSQHLASSLEIQENESSNDFWLSAYVALPQVSPSY